MTITAFSKPTLQMLRPEIDAALAAVAAKHGIELKLGNVSFDAGQFTGKIMGAIPGAVENKQAEALKTFAEIYDLDPEKVSADGYKLVGFDAKRRAKPWIVEKVSTGKQYVMDAVGAKMRFAKAKTDA